MKGKVIKTGIAVVISIGLFVGGAAISGADKTINWGKEGEITSIYAALSTLDGKLGIKQTELKTAKDALVAAEAASKTSKTELDQLKQTNDSLKSQVSELTATVSRKDAEVQQKNGEIQQKMVKFNKK